MSFLHDVFFHNTRFEVSETTLAKLYPFAEYNRAIPKPVVPLINSYELRSPEFPRIPSTLKGSCVSLSPEYFTQSIPEVVAIPKVDDLSNTNTLDFLDLETPKTTSSKEFVPTNTTTHNPPIRSEPISQKQKPTIVAGNRTQNERPQNDKPLNDKPTLFWCVFLAHYGYSEFLRVGKRFQNRELEEKQQIMETLSKNPKQMKDGNMKLTNDSIQEILSGLMVSTNDSFSALVAYSKYYNKTIYVVFACSFLVFSNTKEPREAKIEDICVLYQTRKHPKYGGSYRLEEEPTLEKLERIRETKIEMEHYAKPFRGISAYKLADLEAMAQKIGVLDASGKADLYAKIVEKCCQGIQTI